MYFRMLKKDIKRKKTTNFILLLFIILATMFVSSSVKNIMVALDGTNYFFEEAEVKDFFIITLDTSNGENDRNIEEFIKSNKYADSYTKDLIGYMNKSNVEFEDGREVELGSTMMLNGIDIKQQKFFNKDSEMIKEIKPGHMYIPITFAEDNNIKDGDRIIINDGHNYRKEFIVDGIHKDALLGSAMMGTHRAVMNQEDFDEMIRTSEFATGSLFSVETDNTLKFKSDYSKNGTSHLFADSADTIKKTYIMDLVIAAVLIMVSICLVAIAGVMMKFIITFTVNEDFRQIGIMKAIGMSNFNIRKLYTLKYMVIAIVGGIIGYIASIPFGELLIKNVTKNIIVRGGGISAFAQISISIILVVITILVAYLSTGRLRKMTPMDAIRSGENGERFKRKGVLSLRKTHMGTTTFMACNDILNSIKKYIALLALGIIGMWLVIMPVNTINTLSSSKISKWFSMIDCDMWISDDEMLQDCMYNGDDEYMDNKLDEIKNNLENKGIKVKRVYCEMMFSYNISKGDNSYTSIAFKGYGTSTEEYAYEKGTAPKYENEVALAYTTAKAVDAHVGDTVLIKMGDGEKEYIVTALYQSMNNMGEGIRFYEGTKMDFQYVSGGFGFQVDFEDGITEGEEKEFYKTAGELYYGVKSMEDFLSDMLGGIADQLLGIKTIILIVVIIINILVVVLMQKMFLITEKGQIAMLKSVGFNNKSIITWQTKRISFVLLAGIIVGVLTSTPFSQITSGQVFKLMGATSIEFVINPVEVYLIYPLSVFLAAVTMCVLVMLSIRKINVSDMNSEE